MYRRLFGIDKKKMDKLTLRLLDFFFGGGGGQIISTQGGVGCRCSLSVLRKEGGDAEYYHSGKGGRWLLLRRKGWEVVVVANAAD